MAVAHRLGQPGDQHQLEGERLVELVALQELSGSALAVPYDSLIVTRWRPGWSASYSSISVRQCFHTSWPVGWKWP